MFYLDRSSTTISNAALRPSKLLVENLLCTPALERDVTKAVHLSIKISSRCSVPIRSLVKFVQGLIWLVGVNLTPTRMGLTDISADCETAYEVPLMYWYHWIPMTPSQATSGTGSIALWTSTSVLLVCKGHPLV